MHGLIIVAAAFVEQRHQVHGLQKLRLQDPAAQAG